MERKTISVIGMSCNGCEENVENALQSLDGVSRVEADHETDTVNVVVDNAVTDDDLTTAIEGAATTWRPNRLLAVRLRFRYYPHLRRRTRY